MKGDTEDRHLHEYTTKIMTKAKTLLKFKPPNSEAAWNARIGAQPWKEAWKITAKYATPRDQVTGLKIQHRNLWCAKYGGMECTKCTARGCGYEENMQHLVYCPIIYTEYWERVGSFIHKLGLGGPFHINFWITGVRTNGKRIDTEGASIWFLAWRTLYAQVTYSHINNTHLDINKAYAKLIQLILSRVKA